MQYKRRDVGFWGSGSIAQDLSDEIEAYQAQYSYSPRSVGVNNVNKIDGAWVQNLRDEGGSKIYAPGGAAMTGVSPLNKNSNLADFVRVRSLDACFWTSRIIYDTYWANGWRKI